MDYSELITPEIRTPQAAVRDPPGFNHSTKSTKTATKVDQASVDELKTKKAWELAVAPAKLVPMNVIMGYMTGNSLQIIPMTMTLMLLWNPLKAIVLDTSRTFKSVQTDTNASQITLSKIVFVICQLLNLSIGVYKLYKMGLIPHTESDWLAWKLVVNYREFLS